MGFNRKALDEAELADVDELNRWYSDYGNHFRDQFIEGLKLVVTNSDIMTPSTAIAYLHGQELMNKFGDWYTANLDSIRHKKTGCRVTPFTQTLSRPCPDCCKATL
jgi:hypothetical protein